MVVVSGMLWGIWFGICEGIFLGGVGGRGSALDHEDGIDPQDGIPIVN